MSTVNELLNYFVVNDDNDDLNKNDEKNKNKEKTVVRRYFPGKKPHYAKKGEDDDDEDDDEDEEEEKRDRSQPEEQEKDEREFNKVINEPIIKKEHENKNIITQNIKHNNNIDNRYERLKNKNLRGDNQERIRSRRREVTIIDNNENEKLDEHNEENVKKVDEYEDIIKNITEYNKKDAGDYNDEDDDQGDDEDDEEDDDDDDDEDDEEDDDEEDDSASGDDYMNEGNNERIMKHEFIFKTSRRTLMENKNKEEAEKKALQNLKEEKELIEIEKKENAIKEVLNQDMLEEKLKNKENNVFSSEEDFEEDEQDEELNEQEYELWKIRHINRLKRDELDRKKYEILELEIEKRRKMTDKEIIQDNKTLPNKEKKKKKKMLFMQKYYHKGGFYQDLFEEGKEEIYLRDYNEPVYEDKIDRQNLPKVLQVRRGKFGKQGQSKYTHLLDNDTSRKDSLWNNIESNIKFKEKKKDQFDRPTYRKKN
ncbi:micro-fibrillar-associated protein, putative [Plasmodium sp. gorilla clade G2]|uniref:micro-fibrillar-associated protein, putative n=1 Tax=Plasmodium sp. gorilla clade G2 TaxID=880535 RepID=UPI000D2293D9|nr:micro-fibrillar-associated protein, putative [Plasmodium sp. gorilla clade G2]SOV17752.1 micro-fibrillar-associated protein, putative [Plasmodium sp. gorilla clade G2]